MNKKKKIMVADDDSDILAVLTLMLEHQGYEVDASLNGEKIYGLKADLPDLILLDLWMSGMDGRDICKYLKSRQLTQCIPIIIISAHKNIEEIARNAGADDFVAKPFQMNELLEKVTAYIKR